MSNQRYGIYHCPFCEEKLHIKTQEPYKIFSMCLSGCCPVVSVIITTTRKQDLTEVLESG